MTEGVWTPSTERQCLIATNPSCPTEQPLAQCCIGVANHLPSLTGTVVAHACYGLQHGIFMPSPPLSLCLSPFPCPTEGLQFADCSTHCNSSSCWI